MDKEREIACEILDEFEELLDYHQIDIPDDERESGAFECRLYGGTYYKLEDRIVEILNKGKDKFTKIVEEKLEMIKEDKSDGL